MRTEDLIKKVNFKTDDIAAQKILAEQQAKKEKQLIAATAYVMGHANGRYFVQHLLDEFGLNNPIFDTNGQVMAKKAGMQMCAQTIKGLIAFSVGLGPYQQMEKESVDLVEKDITEIQNKIADLRRKGLVATSTK